MSRAASDTPATLEVVAFMAGGQRFAVEAAQVRTQLPASPSAALPGVEQLLGLPGLDTPSLAPRRILMLKHPAGDYAVTVCAPLEIRTLERDAIHPLPALIAARGTLAGMRGLAMEAGGVTVLVDFRGCERP